MKFSQQFFSNGFFEQDNARLELTDLARKACFIHQDAAGLYSWMSLGLRAQRCIESIVREEMERAGFCMSMSFDELVAKLGRRTRFKTWQQRLQCGLDISHQPERDRMPAAEMIGCEVNLNDFGSDRARKCARDG